MSDESWRDAENAKAIAAAGKQMDDWAARFGGNVFGAVKISYGENEGHIVKIGEAPSPALEQEVIRSILSKNATFERALERTRDQQALDMLLGRPAKLPWYRKFWNMIRGIL